MNPGGRSIDLEPEDDDTRENLALALHDGKAATGDLSELDRAVAVLAPAFDDTARASRLDQLAVTLRLRAVRRDDNAELRRALQLHERVADSGSAGAQLEAWLAAVGGVPADTSHARSRTGDVVSAVTALDACLLAEELDAGAPTCNASPRTIRTCTRAIARPPPAPLHSRTAISPTTARRT